MMVPGNANSFDQKIKINEINWLGFQNFLSAPSRGWSMEVKVRSTKPPIAALVKPMTKTTAIVSLTCDELGISPGQACVFYETGGSRVLGGGWIARD